MMKEQEAISYLESLERGQYVTVNIPISTHPDEQNHAATFFSLYTSSESSHTVSSAFQNSYPKSAADTAYPYNLCRK